MSAQAKVRVKQKRCTQCHEVKSIDDFSPLAHGADGHSTWCKPCKRLYQSKARLAARSKWAAIAAEAAAEA